MTANHDNSQLNGKDVQRRFNRIARDFDTAGFVHTASRDGLLARLRPMLIEAQTVVDLGSATGSATRPLKKRFSRARVISVDLCREMLQQGRRKQSWFARPAAIQARAEALPFADQSVDVVFSNLLLPWIDNPAAMFAEVARVLRKDGLLLFATLGPDSLLELRQAWQAADNYAHVNRFLDMHDVGDAAVQAGLRDPVLDVDRMSVTYDNAAALFQDLTSVAGRNCLKGRNQALTGRSRFATMLGALDNARKGGLLTLNIELVYGHCWGIGPRATGREYRVDSARIGRRGH